MYEIILEVVGCKKVLEFLPCLERLLGSDCIYVARVSNVYWILQWTLLRMSGI